MPIYESDSDNHSSYSSRFSASSRSLHRLLGGGYVADILFWRNKKISAAVLVIFTLTWFLFEVVEYPFVTLLCQILIVLMFFVLIWSNLGTELIKWRPLRIDDIRLSESTCRALFSKLNWLVLELYDISTGKDFRVFIMILASLWIFSILGTYISSLTLLYIVFVCLETIPVLYERYQGEVNYVASKSGKDAKKLFENFNTKVLEKIPRGPVKEKRRL